MASGVARHVDAGGRLAGEDANELAEFEIAAGEGEVEGVVLAHGERGRHGVFRVGGCGDGAGDAGQRKKTEQEFGC